MQLQLQVQLHHAPLHSALPHYNYNYNYNYNCNCHYTCSYNYKNTRLHYTSLRYTTLHLLQLQVHLQLRHFTLHYTRPVIHTTLGSVHHFKYNCNYTALIALDNYKSTTLQLQLQLHYTTLHPAVVGEVTGDHCNHCSHTPKTEVQPPFSPSVGSLGHPSFTTTKLT